MYKYENLDYKNAVKEYLSGNKAFAIAELEWLKREKKQINKEIIYFLSEILQIAKEHNDHDVVSLCEEISKAYND